MPLSSSRPRPFFAYSGWHFRVMFGVAAGDALAPKDRLILDDHYALTLTAQRIALQPAVGTTTLARFALEAAGGTQAPFCQQDAHLTFIRQDGTLLRVLLFTIENEGQRPLTFAAPLAPIEPRLPYRLIAIDAPLADWPKRGTYPVTPSDEEHRVLLSKASARTLAPGLRAG